MITSDIINLFETILDAKFQVKVLAEHAAFPTAGEFFVKMHMDFFNITASEQMVVLEPVLGINTIVRTRKNPIENRKDPYLELLDLTVAINFFILYHPTLKTQLAALIPGSSVSGLFTSEAIRCFPEEVGPEFFGSTDNTSIRKAGYILGQTIRLPLIHVNTPCSQLNDAFVYPSIT